MPPVPIKRRFTPVPAAYQKDDLPLDEVWSHLSRGHHKCWSELLNEYRVVILADAGAGKTYELESAARDLCTQGKPAFFLRIEDIDDNFATAFEVGSEELFGEWLAGSDEAWFFLDSVDEIRLTEPRAFEQAIRNFAKRVRSASQRTHIYISSRPYAWRAQRDRSLIEEVLPFDPVRQEVINDDDSPAEFLDGDTVERNYSTASVQKNEPSLQLYQLASLEQKDIRLFAEHSGVADSSAFLDALERSALFPLAKLPFDLRDLIATWRETQRLASRLEILQQGILRQLKQAPLSALGLPLERAEAGVQLIAIAAILTGRSNILLPDSPNTGAMDPKILLPGWTDAEILAVLTSGIFGDPIFGEVRFRHREIRELLAASWIKNNVELEAARGEIEQLIFRRQYDEDILTPRLRPILPWLILFDDAIRDRVIPNYPQVAVEGGDAANLPLPVRREILSKMIEHVLDPISIFRGVDNAAIARIAQPDLAAYVLELIEAYAHNEDAIFILGRLVWQGEMRTCLDTLTRIAVDPERGLYARMASVRAVACVGNSNQLHTLWRSLITLSEPIPGRLMTEIIAYAPATAETITLLLESLDKLELPQKYEATGMPHAMNEFVQRLPIVSSQATNPLLLELAEGLLGYLEREPHIQPGECPISKMYVWLMDCALHCIGRLIIARHPSALSPVSLTILAAAPTIRLWHGEDHQEHRSTIDTHLSQWQELNDALFWWTVAECRKQQESKGKILEDDWPVTWPEHFWTFDETSFERTLNWIRERPLHDDQLVALSRSVRTYKGMGQPSAWLDDLRRIVAGNLDLEAALESRLNPPVTPDTQRYEEQQHTFRESRVRRDEENALARAKFVNRLRSDPNIIRHPPGLKPSELSTAQFHLLQSIEDGNHLNQRADAKSWKVLIPEFGVAVAEAYRDASKALWRAYRPKTRSEGANAASIPYAIVFGLSGLNIEIEEDSAIIETFEKAQARHALRYVLWELNGFPRWFEVFYRSWTKLSLDFLWKEVEWELKESPVEQSLHYVLHDLVYYAIWLHADLGPKLYDWLLKNHVVNQDCLRYCRIIMMGGGVTAHEVATLAGQKIADTSTPPEQIAIWHAMRTDADPALSLPALIAKFNTGTLEERTEFGSAFSVALLGSRRDVTSSFDKFKTPSYLKRIYLLIHGSVKASDDIERAGKGVYSPTLRDDAQDARERLFSLLAEIPNELAYRAILELADEHPEPRYRDYMRVRAYQRAEQDGDLSAWSTSQVSQLAYRLAGRPDNKVSAPGDDNAKA